MFARTTLLKAANTLKDNGDIDNVVTYVNSLEDIDKLVGSIIIIEYEDYETERVGRNQYLTTETVPVTFMLQLPTKDNNIPETLDDKLRDMYTKFIAEVEKISVLQNTGGTITPYEGKYYTRTCSFEKITVSGVV